MGETHWAVGSDYFCLLLRSEPQSCSALEYLVDDLHADKEQTVIKFLNSSGSEDFLWALVRFLGNSNPRVAGNAAFIIGTIAESERGRLRVISLCESRHEERKRILPDLVKLLVSQDTESVMNAAGTIGTLAESDEGRDWLLRESCTRTMIERVTGLLSDTNAWTASNAALVLARLTISESGCLLLLDIQLSKTILSQLIASLGTDEAGRGMNAAFAVGRLCDVPKGRDMLLTMPDINKMVTHLGEMLCSDDRGSSKNACFAISCLAGSSEGLEKILESSVCDRIINTLAQVLTADDHETGWFAAMTLHTFAGRPQGCVKLRELVRIVPLLQEAVKFGTGNEDMVKEAEETLDILKLLSRPSPPVAQVLGTSEVSVSWEAAETKCGLPVLYKLLDAQMGSLYIGPDTHTKLSDLPPSTTLTLKLRASTQGDDSPLSDSVTVTTDEELPGEPSQLVLLAQTATQLKVGWSPPGNACGVIKSYHVYVDGSRHMNTTELNCIISSLKETSTHNVEVSASTSKGKGPRASIVCSTTDLGDHCPSKPVLTIMGRSEISVAWNPPQVPLGRITRYDVSMNGKVFYSGTELYCTARHLTPNTEYTFIVTVITNEGPQESKPSKKKTPKDEFDVQRTPLYVPPMRREETENPSNQTASKKRRRKSTGKPIVKEKAVPGGKTKPVSGIKNNSMPGDLNGLGSPTIEDAHRSRTNDNHLLHSAAMNSTHTRSWTRSKTHVPESRTSRLASSRYNHRNSLPASVDKLCRSVTKLNIATFEPLLPKSAHSQQRSATFIGHKRPTPQRQTSAHSSIHPPSSVGVRPDFGSKSATEVNKSGRFVPMQYRTQPLHMPNSEQYVTDNHSSLTKGALTSANQT